MPGPMEDALTFHGQAAHSGSTPMNRRKDALLAAARMSPEIYRITDRHGGVCTIGSCTTKPGIVTVPHPKKDIPVGTLASIERQA